jgi:predicted DsbA family dithiol-disulfide isomerase
VLEHKAFPLRPVPDPSATFKGTYREAAWRRCGQMSEGDGIVFAPWPHADHYPHWSLPALEAAACVARQGAGAFDRVHLRLYEAFFGRSLDIADPRVVVDVVGEAGVDLERFVAEYRAGAGRDAVVADYKAAIEEGVRSIPTVVFPASGRALVGLADLAQYRAAVEEAARC